ncbi:MAG TPA: CHAT domain-containing protein [Longimicrobium sp.]|nr:CHAT domain-containing protein [Longimicrobium sp.]
MISSADPSEARTIPRPRWMSVAGAMLLCALSTCGRPAAGTQTSGIAAALAASPGIAPRLSVPTAFRRCVESVPANGTVTRADCPAPRKKTASPLALAGIPPGARDPRSVHQLALLDLTANDPRGIALDHAISSLRRVIELSDDPTPALVDLSAALIVRAERQQTPRDLLEAYETAQKAADRQPHNAAALYNRALALDRFGLVEETAEDWKLAIAADSTSDWADDARRRLDTLQSIHAPVPPRDDAPLADYARYAAEEPQGARELGMDKLLPEWGEATLRGDRSRADDRLRRAEALGTALLRRPGGDASLADMVAAIRRVLSDTSAVQRLAGAHVAFKAGRTALNSGDIAHARFNLGNAVAWASASPCLVNWSDVYMGSSQGADRERLLSIRSLGSLVGRMGERYPALTGRAQAVRAVFLGRDDLWEGALTTSHDAARRFERAGEARNAATALSFGVEVLFELGETDSAYKDLLPVLRTTIRYSSPARKHNLLASISDPIANDGFPAAALRLQNEGVRAAASLDSLFQAEARLQRARLLATLGRPEQARSDVIFARGIIARMSLGASQGWLAADLKEAEATTLFAHDPKRQTAAFDTAARYFIDIALPFRALRPIIGAAETRLSVGDETGAMAQFDAVNRILRARRDSIRMESRRAAVFERAHRVLERLVMLKLDHGAAREALEYLDHARASLAVVGRAARESAAAPSARVNTRPGEVALVYSRVADTLLVWTVDGPHSEVWRGAIDTVRFTRSLQQLATLGEHGAAEEAFRPGLRFLHDVLLRPVRPRLGPPGTPLVIVSDGEFSAVPYPALLDSSDQYLIERHPVRFAVSLAESQASPSPMPEGAAVFVADPAFVPAEFPLFNRLAHAQAEVDTIAGMYREHVVLAGPTATRQRLFAAIKNASMLHVAAHAVFDDARPERSFLILANSPDGSSGRLTAAELAVINFRRLRLVVLSACTTARSGSGRAAGYSGLAGALLAAGASGVVGSIWQVDDRETSAFMRDFHNAYSASTNPAQALRSAQLTAIHARNGLSPSPAVWAAFRYTGR